MATCAGCERPIRKGDKFAIIETEVFHRVCVSNAEQSVLTRTKIALIRARQAVNEQAQVDGLRKRIRELEDEVERWKRDRNAQWGVAAKAESDLSMARIQLSRAASDTIVERSRATTAERLLADERETTAMLTREVRALRDAGKPPMSEIPAKVTAAQDDTVIRYSLLELDLPK